MKGEFVRNVVVFEDHFKEFRKALDKEGKGCLRFG